MKIPALTTDQMIEVDRLMVEEYGILLIQMMENAGRNLADMAVRMLDRNLKSKRIAVLCGMGNNGGGGMVAARFLHNRGADIRIVLVGEIEKLEGVPRIQWEIIYKLGLPAVDLNLEGMDLVIDAMIGYGLKDNPRPLVADWIQKANRSRINILALDAPSGLNLTTGIPANPCIRAVVTLTLALPKMGLFSPAAKPQVGELYLADIGVPTELYRRFDLEVGQLFGDDSIIHLDYQ